MATIKLTLLLSVAGKPYSLFKANNSHNGVENKRNRQPGKEKKNTEDTEKNPENGPERTSKLGRN